MYMARSVLTTNNEGSSVHLFADKTVASADLLDMSSML